MTANEKAPSGGDDPRPEPHQLDVTPAGDIQVIRAANPRLVPSGTKWSLRLQERRVRRPHPRFHENPRAVLGLEGDAGASYAKATR